MKIFITFILSVFVLFAYDKSDHLRIQILETIITNITIEKDKKVWCDDKEILKELANHNNLQVVQNCNDATVIILKNKENLSKECKSKYIFTLNYQLLSETKESFGALFWKKGRPNIVILEPRIEEQNIKISKDLEPYLEEQLW